MFFLRLTLYTCAYYAAMATPIILGELAIEHWAGIFGVHLHGRAGIFGFIGLWGIIWLTSFLLAFRSTFPFFWSKLLGQG